MKKLSTLAVALIAILAIGSVTTAMAVQSLAKKVPSKVTLSYTRAEGPYDQSSFNGKVTAKKKVCRKGRKVIVKNANTGQTFGQAKTDRRGKYAISAGSGATPRITYQATVKKKKVRKTVCKKAKSNKVTVS